VLNVWEGINTMSVEGAFIVRSKNIPYLVCTFSAPITEYGFSFSRELIFTDLLEDASAILSDSSAKM
jgi:hypothetical protein